MTFIENQYNAFDFLDYTDWYMLEYMSKFYMDGESIKYEWSMK